jgi:hypothetical protein
VIKASATTNMLKLLGGTAAAAGTAAGGATAKFPAVNIGGYNWLRLRDVAALLSGSDKQFIVSYDAATNSIIITSGTAYVPDGAPSPALPAGEFDAIASLQNIIFNGQPISLAAYNIGGFNYFRLRDLAALLDFALDFDGLTGLVTLDPERPYGKTNDDE